MTHKTGWSRSTLLVALMLGVSCCLSACGDSAPPPPPVTNTANGTPDATSNAAPTISVITTAASVPTTIPVEATATVPAGPTLAIGITVLPTPVPGKASVTATPTTNGTTPTPTRSVNIPQGGLIPAYPGAATLSLSRQNYDSLRGVVKYLDIQEVFGYRTSDSLDKVKTYLDGQFRQAGWQVSKVDSNNVLLSAFAFSSTYTAGNGQRVVVLATAGSNIVGFGVQGVKPVDTVFALLTNFKPDNPVLGEPKTFGATNTPTVVAMTTTPSTPNRTAGTGTPGTGTPSTTAAGGTTAAPSTVAPTAGGSATGTPTTATPSTPPNG